MMELDRHFIEDTFDEAVKRIPMLHKYTGEVGIGNPSLYFPESREWTRFSEELLLHPAFGGSICLIKNKKGEFGLMISCVMKTGDYNELVFIGRFQIDEECWDNAELIDLDDVGFVSPLLGEDGDLFEFEPLDEDLSELNRLIEGMIEEVEEDDLWLIELNLN